MPSHRVNGVVVDFARRLADTLGVEFVDAVTWIVEASDFDDLESVPLAQWFKANSASLGASVDAWCRSIGEDLPDLPELNDLRQARQAHVDRGAS